MNLPFWAALYTLSESALRAHIILTTQSRFSDSSFKSTVFHAVSLSYVTELRQYFDRLHGKTVLMNNESLNLGWVSIILKLSVSRDRKNLNRIALILWRQLYVFLITRLKIGFSFPNRMYHKMNITDLKLMEPLKKYGISSSRVFTNLTCFDVNWSFSAVS